jgi:hypothetical protein
MSVLGLDLSAIATMPGGAVMRLTRDILNDEAFRIATLEELLVKNGVAGALNAERVAVVRALHAWSDATTLMLARIEDDNARAAEGRPERPEAVEARKARMAFVKLIADQMRAALISDDTKGAGHEGAAA